jgi:hypothetical protein
MMVAPASKSKWWCCGNVEEEKPVEQKPQAKPQVARFHSLPKREKDAAVAAANKMIHDLSVVRARGDSSPVNLQIGDLQSESALGVAKDLQLIAQGAFQQPQVSAAVAAAQLEQHPRGKSAEVNPAATPKASSSSRPRASTGSNKSGKGKKLRPAEVVKRHLEREFGPASKGWKCPSGSQESQAPKNFE